MNKNIKLFFVGCDFYHFNTARELFLDNNYEIEFYNSTEHANPASINFDVLLFDLNSTIDSNDFFNTTHFANQAPIIFIYSKDTSEKELQKVKSIYSYGYLPIDVSDLVFDITVNKAIEQANEKQNENTISNKLRTIIHFCLTIHSFKIGMQN